MIADLVFPSRPPPSLPRDHGAVAELPLAIAEALPSSTLDPDARTEWVQS